MEDLRAQNLRTLRPNDLKTQEPLDLGTLRTQKTPFAALLKMCAVIGRLSRGWPDTSCHHAGFESSRRHHEAGTSKAIRGLIEDVQGMILLYMN